MILLSCLRTKPTVDVKLSPFYKRFRVETKINFLERTGPFENILFKASFLILTIRTYLGKENLYTSLSKDEVQIG